MFVNSLQERHRQVLDHVRVNRYGGGGAWPSVHEVQESARDLDTHVTHVFQGYSNAVATPRPRPLPVHQLSASDYPVLPPPALPTSYPASRYTPSLAPPSLAPSSPSRLDVLLAQAPRPVDHNRADRKAKADARDAAGLCRYCGDAGHWVDSCPALARKEAMKALPTPPSSSHPKG